MLWALLFSLIFSSPESGMINAKFKKHVKKYVEEKERKDELLLLVKNFEKEAKINRKKKKKAIKELEKLNANRSTTSEGFKTFFTAMMNEKAQMDTQKVVMRLKVQGLIENEEWDQIVIASKAYWDKNAKRRKKDIAKLEKSFLKVEKHIQRKIIDQERKAKALNIIANFKKESIRVEKAIDQININESPAMRDQQASRDEIEEMIINQNQLRWKLFDAFIVNHDEMVKITTEEEWKNIVRTINKIF